MSILLDALRQKSRSDANRALAVEQPSAPKQQNKSAAQTLIVDTPAALQLSTPDEHAVLEQQNDLLTLESALAPLNIQMPDGLSWQLSPLESNQVDEALASDAIQHHDSDNESSLALLFPVADNHTLLPDDQVAMVQPSMVEQLESDDHLSLFFPEVAASAVTQYAQDVGLGKEADNLIMGASGVPDGHLDHGVDAALSEINGEQHDNIALHEEDMTLQQDPLTEVITLPVADKQPDVALAFPEPSSAVKTASDAEQYLALKHGSENKAKLSKQSSSNTSVGKPLLVERLALETHQLSGKVVVTLVTVTTVLAMSYYGWTVWDDGQQKLSSQLAVYQAPMVIPQTDDAGVQSANATPTVTQHEKPEAIAAELSMQNRDNLPAPLIDDGSMPIVPVEKKAVTSAVVAKRHHLASVQMNDTQPVISYPAYRIEEPLNVAKSLPISSLLTSAWNSWHQGDVISAEKNYRNVLEKQPNNRDALIGMLAVTQLQPSTLLQTQEIAARLRELYPQDAEVNALTARFVGASDAKESQETQLKNQLQIDPNNAATFYQLGIFYASEKRWSEAQAAFFKAVSLDVGQPEYLANLAIAYDQLGKTKLALSSYQNALNAAQVRPSTLNQEALQQRLTYLTTQVGDE
jgi:tetratricopeptide (TPR) repeat protein